MTTNQEGKYSGFASIAGVSTGGYNEVSRLAFEAGATVPAGATFNEAFILWLQAETGSSNGNINDLKALYASQNGFASWDAVNSIAASAGVFANLTSAQLGDSFVSSQQWGTPTSILLERRSPSWLVNLNGKLFQQYDMPFASNFGVSGATTTGILTQVAGCVAYIQANSVDVVFLSAGTNDVESTSTSIATITSNIESVLDDILAEDVYVVAMLPTVRGDWSGESTGNINTFSGRLHDIRAIYTDYQTANPSAKLVLCDAYDDLVDTGVTSTPGGFTYSPLAGYMSSDGVHYQHTGAEVIAAASATAMKAVSAIWGTPNAVPSVTGALNSNTNWSGTGGAASTGASGSFADGIRVERVTGSNMTAVGSKVTANFSDFGVEVSDAQQIVYANATTTEEFYVYTEHPEPNATYALNDKVQLSVLCKVTGVSAMDFFYLYVRITMGGTNYITKDQVFITGNTLPTNDRQFMLQTEGLPMPAGTTTRSQFLVRVQSQSGGTLTAQFGFYLRKVT